MRVRTLENIVSRGGAKPPQKGENMIRVIYRVEAYNVNGKTSDDVLVARRFARNKKTAERIAKEYEDSVIYKLSKDELKWVNPKDIEG